MRKLLSANLRRLWISKAFWLTVAAMACTQIACSFFARTSDGVPMDVSLFMSLQAIGVLVGIFLSLFLGTEYSDGTMRNKLVVGHKRDSIYLSSLATGIIAATIIFLAEVLTGSVVGVVFYAAPQNSIGQIVLAGVMGWVSCISLVSVFNFVGMLSSSKATTAIICLMLAYLLMILGLYTFQALSKPDMVGVEKMIYQILFETNPSGQILRVISIDTSSIWTQVAYSLLVTIAFTGAGLWLFRKKDLK